MRPIADSHSPPHHVATFRILQIITLCTALALPLAYNVGRDRCVIVCSQSKAPVATSIDNTRRCTYNTRGDRLYGFCNLIQSLPLFVLLVFAKLKATWRLALPVSYAGT